MLTTEGYIALTFDDAWFEKKLLEPVKGKTLTSQTFFPVELPNFAFIFFLQMWSETVAVKTDV